MIRPNVSVIAIAIRMLPRSHEKKLAGGTAPAAISTPIARMLPATASTVIVAATAIQLNGNGTCAQMRGATIGIASPSSGPMQVENRNAVANPRVSSLNGVDSVAPPNTNRITSDATTLAPRMRGQ